LPHSFILFCIFTLIFIYITPSGFHYSEGFTVVLEPKTMGQTHTHTTCTCDRYSVTGGRYSVIQSQPWCDLCYTLPGIHHSITHAHICGLPLLSIPTSFHLLQKPTIRTPIMELGGMIELFSRNAFNFGNIFNHFLILITLFTQGVCLYLAEGEC
jgi:hypothetical protein